MTAATNSWVDESDVVDKLSSAYSVCVLFVTIIKEIINVFNRELQLHALDVNHEVLLADRCIFVMRAAQYQEKLIKCQIVEVFDADESICSAGQQWVDGTLLKEGYVDATTGHVVDEVFQRAFELVVIRLPQIFNDTFSLNRRDYDGELVHDCLEAFGCDKHVLVHLEVSKGDLLESRVLGLELILHLLVNVVYLLLDQHVVTLQVLFFFQPSISVIVFGLLFPGKVRNVFDFLHVDSSFLALVDDDEDSMQLFLDHWHSDELVHVQELFKRKRTFMWLVLVLEQFLEWEAASCHHVIELHNPVDEQHTLEALLSLEGSCSCLDLVFELLEADRLILTIELETFNKSVNLCISESSLELL